MAWQRILQSATDGPTLTAAARASCIPTADRMVLPNMFFNIKRAIRAVLAGRLSCAVTTPGTARWDICLGSAGTTIVYDTGALNLNIVAKTTVPFFVDVTLVCRAIGNGTATTFFPGPAFVVSEAIVGAAANTAGGNGVLNAPVGAPAVGAGMDNTAASALDAFFTQTVATGSQTVHNWSVDVLN